MKIAITTLGTRGDLQPYVALALGLNEAGHQVRLVSARNEAAFVNSHGLDFWPLDVDIQQLMAGGQVKDMAKGDNPFAFVIGHLKGARTLRSRMADIQQQVWDACLDADLIIYHPGLPIGFFMARALGKRSILANPFPMIPTRAYPAILFYAGPRLGRAYNQLTHRIMLWLFGAMTQPAIRQFWAQRVRPRIDLSRSPIRQQLDSGMPVLNAYSERLFHRPDDWPATVHTTGSWLMPDDAAFTPPADLVQFIEAGAPPVYIGFGSMKDPDSFGTTLELIADTLRQTGQRAVVGLGWNHLPNRQLPPTGMYLIDDVPHTWLFPRMALVVHHGGAGTTAAGLTAGKPTVVVPHNADQPAWGQRVYELGVGARPIKRTKLTAARLSAAIRYALQPAIVAKAAELGQQLRRENGVGRAVSIIDALQAVAGSASSAGSSM